MVCCTQRFTSALHDVVQVLCTMLYKAAKLHDRMQWCAVHNVLQVLYMMLYKCFTQCCTSVLHPVGEPAGLSATTDAQQLA